jgi:imidazoleglycerol phosphate synthase glutamine amidotransferase subunit HisH
MFHKSKPFFGVQFHPEVSGENGRIFLKNFTKLVRLYADTK